MHFVAPLLISSLMSIMKGSPRPAVEKWIGRPGSLTVARLLCLWEKCCLHGSLLVVFSGHLWCKKKCPLLVIKIALLSFAPFAHGLLQLKCGALV